MKLFEYIKTELTSHYDLFQNQAFKDGLDRYIQRYNQNKKDVKVWKKNSEVWFKAKANLVPNNKEIGVWLKKEARVKDEDYDNWLEANPVPVPLADWRKKREDWTKANLVPAHLLLDVPYTDDADTKAMAAALLACLHDSYMTGTLLLSHWPADVKQCLINNVQPRFERMQGESIDSGWGLELKNKIQLAIKTLDNDSDITIDDDEEKWLLIDMAKNKVKRRCRDAIQKATGIGLTKLKKLLKDFEQKKLIERPEGERSGYVITKRGLSVYQKLNSLKA